VGDSWSVGASRGVNFGVVGASAKGLTTSHIYVTSSDSMEGGFVQLSGGPASANVATIAGGNSAINQQGQFRTPSPTDPTGWYLQTDTPSPAQNSFENNYFNPNVPVGSTAFFFNNANNINSSGSPVGLFNYDPAGGTLTFVPEPSTYGVAAGLGLLVLTLRRKLARA